MKRETANHYLNLLDDLNLEGIQSQIMAEEGEGAVAALCRSMMTLRTVVSAILTDLREY